ncbi:MAG: tetratricopeptide repeat protein [Candidatus Krumholzibacteriia bacterium]
MNKQNQPRSGLKFAEAGILFVLILGLTVFVGVRVASNGQKESPVVESAAPAPDRTAPPVAAGQDAGDDPQAAAGSGADSVAVAAAEPESAAEPVASPPHREVTYAEAETAYLDRRYEEAVDLFLAYTETHSGNAWGHYMLGMARWKAGDPEEAEEGFLAALAIKPDHAKSLVNHARVLMEMNRNDEALVQAEKAVAAGDDPSAPRVLARALFNLGQVAEAERAYRTILEKDPGDVWSLNNLGLLLIQQERFEEALPVMACAALRDSTSVCIANNLGVALERSGYVGAARDAYLKALELDAAYAKASESLDRLADRVESGDLIPFDLAAAALRFQAGSSAVVAARGEQAGTDATPAPTIAADTTAQPGEQNR